MFTRSKRSGCMQNSCKQERRALAKIGRASARRTYGEYIGYNRRVGKRFCDVTVETPDGKRHTITVESESVYARRDEVFRPVWSGVPGRSKIAANH